MIDYIDQRYGVHGLRLESVTAAEGRPVAIKSTARIARTPALDTYFYAGNRRYGT